MDATDQASIASDHQPHEGLAEGTAVRRSLIFRPCRPCSGCLLVVAGNCPPIDRTWPVGASSASALFASAMAVWWATRLPASSWLVAIIGWIVGFNLAVFIVEIVFIAFCRPMNRPLGRRPVTLLAQALRMLDWPADLAIDDMPGPRDEVLRHRLGETRSMVVTSTVVGDRRRDLKRQCKVSQPKRLQGWLAPGRKRKMLGRTPMSRRTEVTARYGMRARIVLRDGWRTPLVGVASQPGTRALSRRAGSRPRLLRDHTATNGSGP